MFVNPTKVGISQRVVATLVASALVLASIGYYTTAQAADLANISNTLSDSDPGATPSHTIEFTVPTGSSIAGTDVITITFDSAEDGGVGQDFVDVNTVGSGDLSASVTGSGNAGAFDIVGVATADSFDVDGIVASAGDVVEIVVASGVIGNPATIDSYEIEVAVANATTDTGKTRVAIVDNVDVSAIVDTVFDFTITGLGTSTAQNGTSTTGSTSANTINFGTLVAGGQYNMAQRLNVQTNARNGFVVTVESDGDLESSNGAIIDSFQNGSDVADVGTAWTSPLNDVSDETTWGHWGLRSDDGDLNSLGSFYSAEFGADEYIAVATTPREVFHHDGPSNGVDPDLGEVNINYRLEITPLQEAADDYNTVLTYIATPTF
jgi:hypothetical protein